MATEKAWALSSETRGIEYTSTRKADCEKMLRKLKKDDKEYGNNEVYFIEKIEVRT